jgi:hypothetical protein
MKTTFGFTLAALVAGLALSSCGLVSNNLEANSPRRVNNGYATTFEKGDFVPDKRPLKSKDSRDLRELALTLPIWESESEGSTKWVYENSSAAVDVDHWTTPADGAQDPVKLKRLPEAANGAQRIEIWIPPSKVEPPPSNTSWTSVLQRRDGGWLVETARTNSG